MVCLKVKLLVRQTRQVTGTADSVKQFVSQTFVTIEDGERLSVVAVFLFGKEDQMVDIFHCVVQMLDIGTGGRSVLLAEL